MPYRVYEIKLGEERDAVALEFRLEVAEIVNRNHLRVDGDTCAFFQCRAKPFRDGWSADFAILLEQESRGFELLGCLEKITGVSPDTTAVGSDDCSSGRACESGDESALAPMSCDILAAVRVNAWNDECVNLFLCHKGTYIL